MGQYIGDILAGSTITHMWDTNGADGASITRATNGTVKVYKNSTTTETTTGVTDTEDFDATTGVHHVAIDTSADGTFYAAGNDFHVVLSGSTIDGKSVSAHLFSFSIENRTQKADIRKYLGNAVPTADTAGYPKVTVKSGTGTGEMSLSSGAVIIQSGTGTGQLSISSGVVSADAVKISGDATAADNLETMLDGTGGATLSLGRLSVVSSGVSPTVVFQNTGSGNALQLDSSSGSGLYVNGGGNGIEINASTGYGLAIAVASGGLSAIYAAGGTDQNAMEIIAAGTGQAISATGNSTLNTVTMTLSGNVTGSIGSLAAQAKADVNAEADQALADAGVTTTRMGYLTGDVYALANGASGFAALKSDTAAILLHTGTDGVVVASGSKTGYALASGDLTNMAARFLTMIELDGAVYRYTTNALEQGPQGAGGGGGGDATEANQEKILQILQAQEE